jgi:hypothetical protein
MVRAKTIVGAVAAVAVAGAVLTATPASAGERNDRSGSVVAPADYYGRHEFRVPGVRIWRSYSTSSAVVGLGYPGQGFFSDFQEYTPPNAYTCDNGVTTVYWNHGYDMATGVTGYVPFCNLVAVQ